MPLAQDIAKTAVAGLASVAALLIPLSLLPTEDSIRFIKLYGYYCISGTVAIYLIAKLLAYKNEKIVWKELAGHHWLGGCIILLATLFVLFLATPNFKILFDEYTLSATAKSMHFDQLVYAQTVGHIHNNEPLASVGFVDKRPLLFPFLVSITHTLFGYSETHVFVLNSILTGLLLFLLYRICSQVGGPRNAVLAVLMLTSLPLLTQNAGGGGYELANLCLIATLSLSGISYLQSDASRSGAYLNHMVMCAVLLANIRYESVLYVLVPAALFVLKSARTRSFGLTWFAALSPLLLILPLTTYAIFQAEPRFIQTSTENFFSPSHLQGNLSAAAKYLFEPTGNYSNSILLSTTGIIAVGSLVYFVTRNFKHLLLKENQLTAVAAVGFICISNTTLALSCYWGAWTDPATTRFSLPLQFFLAIAIPFALSKAFKLEKPPVWLTILAVAYLTMITPLHVERMESEPRLTSAIGNNWAMAWVDKASKDGHNLYIAESTVGIGLLQVPTIPINVANGMPERTLLTQKIGLYDELYVLQAFYATKENPTVYLPLRSMGLNARFTVETVAEKHILPGHVFRVARITGLSSSTANNRTHPADLPPRIIPSIDDLEKRKEFMFSLPIQPKSQVPDNP